MIGLVGVALSRRDIRKGPPDAIERQAVKRGTWSQLALAEEWVVVWALQASRALASPANE